MNYLVNAGLGSRTANDADRLARSFACARIGLGALAAHRKPAQVPDAAITLDALQALKVHADLASQVALDDILAVLNRPDDLRQLLLGQVLRTDRGINLGLGQDVFRVAGADAVNVAQRDINALVGRDFYTNDTSHTESGLMD